MAGFRAKHAKRRSGSRLLAALGAALVVAAGALVAVVVTSKGPASKSTSHHVAAAGHGASSAAVPVSFSVQPREGALNQPLNAIVAVTASTGHLTSVAVSGPNGTPVAGTLAGQSWQSSGSLAPSTLYTVSATATGPSGDTVQHSSTFKTLTPSAILQSTIFPSDGLTVGVGMPIELRFNHAVVNKATVIAAMHVTMSTPVPGGWYWFTNEELHFRPETYWPTGEQVTLTADLAGVDAGGGVWADANHSVHFAVGDAHVSTADVASHVMTVTDNGKVVATYPLSAGREKYPTMDGVHIALYRQQDVLMDSSTVGIPRNSPDGYYEHVYWDVAITDGGEFVHAAPWSTGAQGRSNVSHGCINLSVANATQFFGFSRVGDVVQVTNSPRPASLDDHGTMDWTLPWAQWTPAT